MSRSVNSRTCIQRRTPLNNNTPLVSPVVNTTQVRHTVHQNSSRRMSGGTSICVSSPLGSPMNHIQQKEAMLKAREQMQILQNIKSEANKEEEKIKAEKARLKALEENERKMKIYKVDMGNLLGNNSHDCHTTEESQSTSYQTSTSNARTQSILRLNNSSESNTQHFQQDIETVCNDISSNDFNLSTSINNETENNEIEILSKEEEEKRKNELMRQKMLEARQKQQERQIKLIQESVEAKKIATQKEDEEKRIKMLIENENKMKNYKITMGNKLEKAKSRDIKEKPKTVPTNIYELDTDVESDEDVACGGFDTIDTTSQMNVICNDMDLLDISEPDTPNYTNTRLEQMSNYNHSQAFK